MECSGPGLVAGVPQRQGDGQWNLDSSRSVLGADGLVETASGTPTPSPPGSPRAMSWISRRGRPMEGMSWIGFNVGCRCRKRCTLFELWAPPRGRRW